MSRRHATALMLAGVLLLALNVRPAVVSVGTVLNPLQHSLPMPDWELALLTAMPLIAYAVFSALATTAARIFGIHRVTLLSLLAIAIGQFARALADDSWVFLFLSALALAGTATAATLLPSLVRLHFPNRTGAATALTGTALGVGTVLALALTPGISHSEGGWRTGVAVWGVLAVIAAVPWLRLVGHDRTHRRTGPDLSAFRTLRTPLGWSLTLFFGIQALQAYTVFAWFPSLWDHYGYTPGEAALLVALAAAVAVPVSLWLPAAAIRRRDPRPAVYAVVACYPVGFLGVYLHPHGAALLSALLIGVGMVGLPMALVLVALRSRTAGGTAALAGSTQPMGYLIAALGPFGLGLLHLHTNGWRWPLGILVLLAVPQLLLAWYAGRPAYVEDQLDLQPAP
jgi:CP family cyanate transporter-like MFS transporter